MRMPQLTLRTHLLLLAGYALLAFGLVMMPVVLAGFPYKLPWLTVAARQFAETHVIATDTPPILVIVLSWLRSFILWDNLVGWTAVSAGFLAASLFPWWWTVRRMFDVRIAWISTALLSLLPQYWQEVIEFSGYSFSFFFLFLGFALYVTVRERHAMLAVMLMGLCMGAVIASNHAFITFPPFFVCAYLWQERRRPTHAITAVIAGSICAAVVFVLPLLPGAIASGHLTDLLPMGAKPGTGHLYPDDYTFDFLRADYDARVAQEMKDASFLERQANANYGIIFGAIKTGFIGSIGNGVWLFLNILPSFFFEETVGGVFLWLFIIPGIVILWRGRRTLLLLCAGLWLSMEFWLRFVLHFGRAHLNDIGWMLPLFAAVGIAGIVTILGKQRTSMRPALLMAGVVVVAGVQLLQADRTTLAKRYARSDVPLVYAAREALRSVPPDATVAHPRMENLFFFSPQTPVNLHPDTIEYLHGMGKLREPFAHYGIQYIIGYDPEQAQHILAANPDITVIPLPESPPVPVSEIGRFLLNLTR